MERPELTLYASYIRALVELDLERERPAPDLKRAASLSVKAQADRAELELLRRQLQYITREEADAMSAELQGQLVAMEARIEADVRQVMAEAKAGSVDAHPKLRARAALEAGNREVRSAIVALERMGAAAMAPLTERTERAHTIAALLDDQAIAANKARLREQINNTTARPAP